MKRSFHVIFLLLPFLASFGQDAIGLKFDQITTEKVIREKGLSQNTGMAILMDSKGYMWFGTWDGLNRYDGYDFIIYNNERGLSHNTIHSLAEDDQGRLWIATEAGLDRFDLNTGNIESFRHEPGRKNTLSNPFINHLFIDSENNLWISTAYGLNKYKDDINAFSTYHFFNREVDSSLSNHIHSVYQDHEGRLWIATRYGLHRTDPSTEEFEAFYHDAGDPSSLSGNYITSVLQDSQGFIWVGTYQGLNRMDPATGRFARMKHDATDPGSLSSDEVNTLFEGPDGNIWAGTADKLNILDTENNTFYKYKSSASNTSLSNDDIRCIYRDDAGTIWIGTYKGINKLVWNSGRFTHYFYDPEEQNGLNDNIVYAITRDEEGKMWIGTFGGVNILDRETETFTYLTHDPDDPGSLTSNKIRAIITAMDGTVWIGTENSGLNRYDPITGSITHYRHNPYDSTSLVDDHIYCLMEDSRGRIWIGTPSGLNILDPETRQSRHIRFKPNSPIGFTSSRVWAINKDRSGYFWLGTDNGLLQLNEEGEQLQSFVADPEKQNTLSGNRIFSFYEDRDGIYWIGTMGDGLNSYDPVTKSFRHYNESSGLPNNVVYATLEDARGYLWISTNWGISRFDKQSGTFINYGVQDGLQGNEFNAGAYYRNDDGEMFFGGMNGFNVFKPEEIKLNRNKPDIVITAFRVFNEKIRGFYEDGDTIKLKSSDNFFSFEFSALDYTNPSKNQYRYMLENYDKNWILQSAGQRLAEYKKVSPGEYKFRVTGSNNDGIWNEEGVSLYVIITPPWWETWAFRIPFALFVITAFWFLIYSRFRNLSKKHEVEKKVLDIEKRIFDIEQKALRLQMNPHFLFNSLNAIQSFVISNDTDTAIPYLAKFSHLMRMILANSSESFVPLKDEMKAIRYYMDLEKLRFDDKFDYRIELDPSLDEDFIEIPPMILQPYVENAIIHGLIHLEGMGQLTITVKPEEKAVLFIIEDNGIGRKKAREIRDQSGIKRQSRGMMITKERLELMNKEGREDSSVKIIDLTDDQGNPAGTRVELQLQYREI